MPLKIQETASVMPSGNHARVLFESCSMGHPRGGLFGSNGMGVLLETVTGARLFARGCLYPLSLPFCLSSGPTWQKWSVQRAYVKVFSFYVALSNLPLQIR